ncbi:MAG: hypothetical protein KDK12_04590 [Rhodobacteraceae bacterium]|nr:hypothetical protein [Paracoccaceae bacterium]
MRRIALGPVLACGGWRVAAVADAHVEAQASGGRLACWGGKAPLAVLVGGAGGVRAWSPAGEALDRAEIEALAPGIWDQFAAAG